MNKVIKLTLELRFDCEKGKIVKVKPYDRVRNGKSEHVKGRTWLMDPRAPKVEPPEHVRILREKGVNRVD